MTNDYPAQNEKVREMMGKLGKEIPGPMSAFAQLHAKASVDGALSAKVKELIALAIGITVRCNGCIAFHVHDALEAGASRQEVMETIAVAILMGGGPSVVYGAEAMTALKQLEPVNTEV
jgi:AhpD family alkylhydroperoxidase